MARYYMQLRDGTDHLLHPDGIEYADLDELKKKVLIAVRGLMSEDIKGGLVDLRFRIDAEDRKGIIVYTLGFGLAKPSVCSLSATSERVRKSLETLRERRFEPPQIRIRTRLGPARTCHVSHRPYLKPVASRARLEQGSPAS